jgi:predicted Zn-dependent protease with MMP-like domain
MSPAMTRQTLAPSLADIERLARAAIERLPELFRDHLSHVVLRVEDFPDDEVMREMQLESEFDILGLYSGHSVGRSVEVSGALPDTVHLYRRPILDVWAEGEETLEHLVTHVLVHEVGHHFGLSDADIDAIEASVD